MNPRSGPLAAIRSIVVDPAVRRSQLCWGIHIASHHAETVVLAVIILRDDGLRMLAALALLRTIPAAALAPPILVALRRVAPTRVLTGVLGMRALSVMTIAVTAYADLHVGAVLLAASVAAVADAIYWPTHAALLPTLVETPEELTAANVATSSVENVAQLIGPALAGAAMASGQGSTPVLIAEAALLGWGAVLMRTGRTRAAVLAQPHSHSNSGLTGLRFLLGQRDARLVVGLYLVSTFSVGAVATLTAVVAVQLLDDPGGGIGFLTASIGLGGLAGSLLSAALVGRRRLTLALDGSLIVAGLALAAIAALPPVGVRIGVLLALVGVCDSLADVGALTLLQRVVRQRDLGPALAAFEGLWWIVFGLGSASAAAVASIGGARPALTLTGALLFGCGIGSLTAAVTVDRRVTIPAARLALLRDVSLFAGLRPIAMERLAYDLMPAYFPAGSVVMAEGMPGDLFYLLEDGRAVVDGTGSPEPTELGPGAWFGELALLHDQPRNATVRAATDLHLYALDCEQFLSAVAARTQRGVAAPAGVKEEPPYGQRSAVPLR